MDKNEIIASLNPVAITFHAPDITTVWTNMPAAVTEFFGGTRLRTRYPLWNCTMARLISNINVAGSANAKLKVQYSLDLSNWYDLGPVNAINFTGMMVSAWADIPMAAKHVYLRIAGISGDGVADPSFGLTILELK